MHRSFHRWRCETPYQHQPWPPGWKGSIRRFKHSLKWRLVSLFLMLALATTVTCVVAFDVLLHSGWEGYGRPLLNNYVDLLSAEIGTPPDVAKAKALVQRLPISIIIQGPTVNWNSHPNRMHPWQAAHQIVSGDRREWLHIRDLPDGHRIIFGLADPAPTRRMHYLSWATLSALLLITWLAYAYVRKLFRPLDDIREGAVQFGQGDFAYRIPLRRPDELGDLAYQVNTMAGEIQHMLDAKRALLLAISHELRSPLTRARVNAELIDESEARQALLRDLGVMRDMVSDLLESERLTAGHPALQCEPTDVNALVAETLEQHFPGREVATELDPGLPRWSVDRVRLKLLLRNLVDNALRHSAGATRPLVVGSALNGGGGLCLTVRDFGPGVPEEHLSQLSNAFYRADAARLRATGGVGLGLYLCRLVAQAHGGRMDFRNAAPGLEVRVHLPPAKGEPIGA
jgi:signal transduction histidine kinase